jgi:type I restriction enzyme S subunit
VKNILPKGWSEGCLADVVANIAAGTSANCDDRDFEDGDKCVLKLSAVSNGHFNPQECKVASRAEHSRLRTPVRAGTVLFTRKNTPELVGDVAYVAAGNSELYLPDLIWELSAATDVDPRWINYWLQAPAFRKQVPSLSAGSSKSMVGISQESFLDSPVLIPPRPEQRRIVAVLGAWDQVIETLEKLRAANLRRHTWFRNNLLSGKKRLQGYSGEWRSVQLNEVLDEHGLHSSGREAVFSVSVHKGLINQVEHLGRSFAAKETAHYNRVRPGDLVYTKSPTGKFPLGIVKQSKINEEVIVSPLYGVFTPISQELGVILDSYFESPIAAQNYLRPLVQKGAKNTIAITNSRFLEGKLYLPLDPAEQETLAAIVQASQAELSRIEAEIEALKHQKRGLMQKLLGGEWQLDQRFDPPARAPRPALLGGAA